MKKKILGILIVLLLFVVAPVHAKEINSFYSTASDNVSLKDTIKGDSAIAGNLVDIIGNIDGIGFVAGNTVNVNGTLEYGFVAGNNININGNIEKSIYAAGNIITFSKDSKIERDAFVVANEVVLSGEINRDISLGTTKLTIKSDAKIKGDIHVDANKIIVEDGASIEGTLKYNNNAETEISKNASIENIVLYDGNVETDNSNIIFDTLISIANMLVVFAIIVALLPKVCDKTINIYEDSKNYLKNFGIGLLVLFCTQILCILLLISSIGTSLGLILGVLYAISIYLSYVISGLILGDLIVTKLFNQKLNALLLGLIGITILKLLMVVPIAGGLISILALSIGLGTIFELVITSGKNKKENKTIEAKIESKTKKN